MTTATVAKYIENLWLAEFYDREGDIDFAWIVALDKDAAADKLRKSTRDDRLAPLKCTGIVKLERHGAIAPLATSTVPKMLLK